MGLDTVAIGDSFEDEAFEILTKVVARGDLGILEKSAKISKKKKYFSDRRGRDITFDLSIELWPDGANRFSTLYLIECKNFSGKKVHVEHLELFSAKVNYVAELNGKAIFISRSSFSKTAENFARKTGMMLINVGSTSSYEILLYKSYSNDPNRSSDDVEICRMINRNLQPRRVLGLKKLSKEKISEYSLQVLSEAGLNRQFLRGKEMLNRLIEYHRDCHGLTFFV